jgi:CRISPR/Cas system-associated protein Cas10 (large subunit of type III CRISPR-Cas system)
MIYNRGKKGAGKEQIHKQVLTCKNASEKHVKIIWMVSNIQKKNNFFSSSGKQSKSDYIIYFIAVPNTNFSFTSFLFFLLLFIYMTARKPFLSHW